jgi:alkanesulfonate monooxygenase SsuD/methylene tetrahydromethanopterin reductase-like flavin-dependent oxidoreductase (luciferase family)
MMHYGIGLANGGACGDPRSLADFAALAEESGWDGVFLEDYIIWQGHQDVPTFDPWISLAAMAVHTTRIKLGTSITPLPRRRPWKVASEAVAIDHLSNGRLILGVGIGDTSLDLSFTHFGEVVDAKQRGKMLDEALIVLTGLWSAKPFQFEGEFFHIAEVTLLPGPVQQPRIPIWIGGGYPLKGPTQRALRFDGGCLYKHAYGGQWEDWTPDDVRAFRAMADHERGTRAPFDIALGGRHRSEDWAAERTLIKALAEAGATWWIEYVPPEIGGPAEFRKALQRGPLRID